MNETQEKLFDEMRRDLRFIREAFAGSEARREDLDKRMTQLVDHADALGEHLGRQDVKLEKLDGDLGVHLKMHASLRRVKGVMWTAALTMFSGALALYLVLLANHNTMRALASQDARADTALADVAVMTIVCNRGAADTLYRASLIQISCGQAIAKVEARLDGTLTHEAHQ